MKKIYEILKTNFSDKMDKDLPWNEYPRPSMERESFLCLNGYWDFAESPKEIISEFGEKILVPFPPESTLSGINRQIDEKNFIFYRRSFDLPNGFIKDRFILHFGAVDTFAEVYLNGEKITEHKGGYLPFSVDCTDHIKNSDNELIVRVKNDLSRTYPYGKKKKKRGGMWYTPTSGIWQTVWAESVPQNYIEKIVVRSDMEKAEISFFGTEGPATLTLLESGEEFVSENGKFTVIPKEARYWSPDDPYLYDYVITCGEDSIKGYFALREIAAEEFNGIKRLTLNKKPYLFNGLLDQGYFPDGLFLPATSEGYKNDILTAKHLGFNMLRKHIKVEPEIFYNLCDKIGMVVFQDMVNNANYSFLFDTVLPTIGLKRFHDSIRHRNKHTREIFISHSIETIEHLELFPSVLYYTVFNEGWGQFCADKLYSIVKSKAPDKIIDSTSGWFQRRDSDVDSRHVYFKPVKINKPTDKPIIISEFGGYSHRVEGHLFGEANYGYRIINEKEEFMKAFEKLYSEEILPGIARGICGLVYTQVSDIEDETNGIMTYDRKVVKLDRERTLELNKKLYAEMERVTK